ncbi:hypothetical protein NJL88_12865 [Streptomyces sp. DK15]|nr:hypothetical protein [Streptomyces sp. DK15]
MADTVRPGRSVPARFSSSTAESSSRILRAALPLAPQRITSSMPGRSNADGVPFVSDTVQATMSSSARSPYTDSGFAGR